MRPYKPEAQKADHGYSGPGGFTAFERLARESDVTTSWRIRRSMKELPDRHRRKGDFDLRLGREHRGTR